MNLQWLNAPEADVAAAMARLRREGRPSWVPTVRQMLVHVNRCLMLWYLCLAWFTLAVRIDTLQDNRITTADVRDMAVVVIVFLFWCVGAFWLSRWSKRPPSPRSRITEWRQTLTALANGFEPQPTRRAHFRSLITVGNDETFFYPRFVADGIEFGNLRRGRGGGDIWHYLVVKLPVPMPHLILGSEAAGGVSKRLPVRVDPAQRLSLEGDFDRFFQVFAPERYERDALFVLPPDVMAALIDHASSFNIEIVDDSVVFFAPEAADYAKPHAWLAIDAALHGTAPPLVRTATRYRDENVPGQDGLSALAASRTAVEASDQSWTAPRPRIGSAGQRLKLSDRRTGWSAVLGALGWFAILAFLYVVPGLFLFAAVMSIVDGH
ncbi:hypothetical protein ACW5CM_12105 [Microbacterium sp. A588]